MLPLYSRQMFPYTMQEKKRKKEEEVVKDMMEMWWMSLFDFVYENEGMSALINNMQRSSLANVWRFQGKSG